MTRLQDWQIRFAAFVAERTAAPFAWGSNDCCLFAADAVLALTGVDRAQALRGYASAEEAARLVARLGGLRQIATDALGPALPPLMAGVGDVVLVLNEGREILAVCNGTTALCPAADRMAVLGMEAALAAWRV